MDLSPDGLAQLTRREGSRRRMYRDSAGLPTIGVGHLLTRSELASGKIVLPSGSARWGDGLTEPQIQELLRLDAAEAEEAVRRHVQTPLTQAQYDCLVSFVFNVGAGAFVRSTLLRVLNAGLRASVPAELRRWVYAGGVVQEGLKRRRESEVAQWLSS